MAVDNLLLHIEKQYLVIQHIEREKKNCTASSMQFDNTVPPPNTIVFCSCRSAHHHQHHTPSILYTVSAQMPSELGRTPSIVYLWCSFGVGMAFICSVILYRCMYTWHNVYFALSYFTLEWLEVYSICICYGLIKVIYLFFGWQYEVTSGIRNLLWSQSEKYVIITT